MPITRQADYAVRAVLYLAQLEPGMRISTAEVARAQHIPLTFLAKIVSQLSNVGILRTARGAHGGIRLGRLAQDINLLEVVEAIDGPLALNKCVLNPEACPLSTDCPVQLVWCEAQAELVSRLLQTTFEKLARVRPPVTETAPAFN